MHSLDRGERDAVGILETDRFVAVPQAECRPEVLGHRAEMLDLAGGVSFGCQW